MLTMAQVTPADYWCQQDGLWMPKVHSTPDFKAQELSGPVCCFHLQKGLSISDHAGMDMSNLCLWWAASPGLQGPGEMPWS